MGMAIVPSIEREGYMAREWSAPAFCDGNGVGPTASLRGDTVLVTGASGFVGSAIARMLAPHGCALRTLMRPSSPRLNVRGLDVEIFEGDIRVGASVAAAMRGVRYLFHAAADYRLWATNPAEIVDVNERGTRVVMEAALAAGVEKIVHTSSVATLSPVPDGSPADERRRLATTQATGAYKRSKILGEAVVETMIAEWGLPAVMVLPSTPIGPCDVKPTPTGRIIVEAARGRIPAFVDTGLNLVHVDDVAEGHLAALHHGRIGERYILGGQDTAFGTMLADIAELTGRRAPNLRLHRSAIYPAAVVAEALARVTGRVPFLTLDSLRMSRHLMYFSSKKAERELGYRARPYREGLEDALDWYRMHGHLSAAAEQIARPLQATRSRSN